MSEPTTSQKASPKELFKLVLMWCSVTLKVSLRSSEDNFSSAVSFPHTWKRWESDRWLFFIEYRLFLSTNRLSSSKLMTTSIFVTSTQLILAHTHLVSKKSETQLSILLILSENLFFRPLSWTTTPLSRELDVRLLLAVSIVLFCSCV